MPSSLHDKHQGIKSMHLNRDRIKERIQEKHQQQRQQVRQERLSGARETDTNYYAPQDGEWHDGPNHPQQQPCPYGGTGPTGAVPSPSTSLSRCYNPDGTLMVPVVQDWSDIGFEFGVNIQDTSVMEYLLALEDEIRQEQLFQFYDQVNGNDLEEYFESLTS